MGKSLGRKPDTETVIGRAARYHNQGTSAEMIAERLGVQMGTVRVYLSRARHCGLIKGRSDPGDDLRFLMLDLPKPIVDWLVGQVPLQGNLNDLLRGIIADAYSSEMMPEEQSVTTNSKAMSGVSILSGDIGTQ